MPDEGGYDYGRWKKWKVWRYPGVPIPFRLQNIYKDFSVKQKA